MRLKKLFWFVPLVLTFVLELAVAAGTDLPDFTRIVADEGKAVVNISSSQTVQEVVSPFPDELMNGNDPFFEFFRRFAPPSRERKVNSLGSGFIISADGYVLTNAHVVARADEINVSLTDKREYRAKVIGVDARTDVALLKIQADRLPVVRLGRSADLKVGEWVVAIGSPFGFDNTVTAGIISAVGRQLPNESYVPFIQTDAAVNPGNSGGPLFNLKGEVVGMNSQIYSQSGGFMGISFAIPIDTTLMIAEQLKTKGRVSRSRIGVTIQAMNKELAASFGVTEQATGALVSAIEGNSPAHKAGLLAGDIILKVNDKTIENEADLQRAITSLPPGSQVKLTLWRDRSPRTVMLVTEEMPDEDRRALKRQQRGGKASPKAPTDQMMSRLGLVLAELSGPQLAKLGIKYGLMVQRAMGKAAEAGLQPGDVIISVGNDDLSSRNDLKEAIQKAPKGATIALRILRNQPQIGTVVLYVALPLGGVHVE